MSRNKFYVSQSLPTNFELNRLRILRVMEFCLNRSLLFHRQRPFVLFNWMQIKSKDTLDLLTDGNITTICYFPCLSDR